MKEERLRDTCFIPSHLQGVMKSDPIVKTGAQSRKDYGEKGQNYKNQQDNFLFSKDELNFSLH
jgi:hypothetical protein